MRTVFRNCLVIWRKPGITFLQVRQVGGEVPILGSLLAAQMDGWRNPLFQQSCEWVAACSTWFLFFFFFFSENKNQVQTGPTAWADLSLHRWIGQLCTVKKGNRVMRRPPMSAHLFQKERVLAQEATVVLSCCTCFHFKVYDQIPPHLSSLHVIKPINSNYNVYIDLSLKLTFGMKLLLHRFIVSFGFEKHNQEFV